MKIGIVSDSATGFTLENQKKYSEIMIIPLTIIEDNGKVYEDNNIAITSEQIYQKLITQNKNIKTSQTSPGKLKEYWQEALKKYDEILFLPIANDASGQYQNAKVLADDPEFKNKVHVYETGAAGIALKNMAITAWELSQNGSSTAEIIKKLNEYRQKYDFYLTPTRLNYLVRGGRIPNSLVKVSNLLKLKAIIHCKEKIKKAKIRRTMNHAMKDMLTFILEFTKDAVNETLYVINGWCDNSLLEQAITIANSLGFKTIKVESLCNILKTHTGNNTIGFAVTPDPNKFIK